VAKVILHQADEPLYSALPEQPAWIGIPRGQWAMMGMDFEQPPAIDEYWQDGQDYRVGELLFKVIHCPGHTPGHVVFFFENNERKVFVGDCLFCRIDRANRPAGGSSTQLMDSILNKLCRSGRC